MEPKADDKHEISATFGNSTSPSQLQEVTLDPDVTTNFSYMGLRSPGAMTSGRSVKEIDEQLTNLRKENFNLKLRIYFLEERMGANFNTDKEDAIKKNIELMVELENVRKELEDKQELLCQAAKAMEIEEEEKKKEVSVRDQEIYRLKEILKEVDCQLQNERLENKQMTLCTEAFNLNPEEPKNNEVIKKLQNTVKDLQAELKKEQGRADQFEEIIKVAENARVALKSQIEERDKELYELTLKLEETNYSIAKFNIRISTLEEELDEKTTELERALNRAVENDEESKDNEIQLKEMTKQYEAMQQQKDKYEKKAEKYKSSLTQSEIKYVEMVTYTDTLKRQIQNLEVRLAAALQEVKRTNSKSDTFSPAEQRHKSNDTDVALFSVRTTPTVPETSPSKNLSAKINRPFKSIHSRSPSTVSSSSSKPQSNNDKHSSDTSEIVVYNASHDVKNFSTESSTTDAQLSQEEIVELKKNHYKACKIIKTMIQKKKEYIEQIDKLQKQTEEKDSKIQSLRDSIVELNNKIDSIAVQPKKSLQEKVSELHFTASLNQSANKENSMAGDDVHLAEQYKELANELEKKIEVLNATLSEKDLQMERLKIEMQAKANRIIDLEFELLALNQGVNHSVDLSNEKEGMAETLLHEKGEQEQKIQQLESELRKRTCDLQGIVNKELWEKNRSIEKLQTILKSKDQEISKLEKNMYGKELQLKILKDKINELGIHVNLPPGLIAADVRSQIVTPEENNTMCEQQKVYLEERKHFIQEIEELRAKLINTPEHDENTQFLQLQSQNCNLQEELEKSERLRQENQEICSILSTRLEELGCFLDSLLKQKSVLGLLGTDQTRRLHQVINRSLDFSRTLSTTIALNPDESLLQLSNITNLLNSTRNDSLNLNDFFGQDEENNSVLSIIPSDVTLTYQSHLNRTFGNNPEQIINVLRQQIANLKHEIEVRDVELGKKLSSELLTTTEKLIENEEQFVDAVADLQPQTHSLQVNTPRTIFQNLVSDTSLLNTTQSTLVPEKSPLSNTSTTLKNQNFEINSESESWSEPDRTVSMARIGLHDESLKRLPNASSNRRARFAADTDLSTESTEDSQLHGLSKTPSKRTTLAESRQTVIALHEQVCDLEAKLKEKENQLLAAQVAYREVDNILKQEQGKVQEARKENSELTIYIMEANKKLEETEKQKRETEQEVVQIKKEHSQLIQQIKETSEKLEEAEKQKQESEQKNLELRNYVLVLEEFRRNAEIQMNCKDKQMQNLINEMEIEKTKTMEAAQNAERVLEKAKKDMQVAEKELKNMYAREQKIREELENMFKEKLKAAEEQYLTSVENVKQEYEVQADKCREAVNQIRESYEKDYIKKSEVEKRVLEVEEITKELESLKCIIQDNKLKIRMMEEKENELKYKVSDLQQEHCDKINGLHAELDDATLQYSEAILEKTKLRNENTALEQQVQKLCAKQSELIKQVDNVHKELEKLEYQKSLLESQVKNLENINSKLESANIELHSHLIEVGGSKYGGEMLTSVSLPNNPGSIADFYASRPVPISVHSFTSYIRQLSDQSGYTSEEIQTDEFSSKPALAYAQVQTVLEHGDVDHERLHGNSSPDLGIESDHGRFSSLEANVNIPRPLLPSLELAQSMNNLLDPIQDIACNNEECGKRAKQICNENVDLRKRLLRTRRALEDTLTRLTMANRQKKEVEKSICRQIHKTSQVLRKAKANLDSGSETDILKK